MTLFQIQPLLQGSLWHLYSAVEVFCRVLRLQRHFSLHHIWNKTLKDSSSGIYSVITTTYLVGCESGKQDGPPLLDLARETFFDIRCYPDYCCFEFIFNLSSGTAHRMFATHDATKCSVDFTPANVRHACWRLVYHDDHARHGIMHDTIPPCRDPHLQMPIGKVTWYICEGSVLLNVLIQLWFVSMRARICSQCWIASVVRLEI